MCRCVGKSGEKGKLSYTLHVPLSEESALDSLNLFSFFCFGCSIACIPIFHHHFRCETRNVCNVPLFRCSRGAYGDPATLREASPDIPSGLSVPTRTHIAMCTLKTTRD